MYKHNGGYTYVGLNLKKLIVSRIYLKNSEFVAFKLNFIQASSQEVFASKHNIVLTTELKALTFYGLKKGTEDDIKNSICLSLSKFGNRTHK